MTDVTCIKHNAKWYYLAGCLDLFDNEIVEWELSDTFDNFPVMKPAERLFCSATKVSKSSSAGYCSLLKEHNAIQSM